jgi:exodeoxyribonuclease V alpha subunit
MTEHFDLHYFLKDAFPAASPELLLLFEQAADNAALLRSDFYAIRDWLEISGYQDAETLHAGLLFLLASLEAGSLCVELSRPAVQRLLADLVAPEQVELWTERILAELTPTAFPKLIGASVREHKPVILYTIDGKNYLAFQKYLKAEEDFFAEFTRRLVATPADPGKLRGVIDEVLVEQPLQVNGRPVNLDVEQQMALALALTRGVTIISGGPGTGKTSIVLTILRCLVRLGIAPDRIALAAPTGRAAQRLGDSLRAGLEQLPGGADESLKNTAATTLHQLLGYRPTRNSFSRHVENPIPADVVIVDEVSMVGLVLMSHLLRALSPGARLILLGDKDQLPSIEAGAVLAHLVPEGFRTALRADAKGLIGGILPGVEVPLSASAKPLVDHVVVLQTNHRSQKEIREAALAINRQDIDLIARLPAIRFGSDAEAVWRTLEKDGGCWLLEQAAGAPAELRGFLQHWFEQAYFRSRLDDCTLAELVQSIEVGAGDENDPRIRTLFALMDRYRLLTLVRESAWGCDEINRFAEQCLRPRLDIDSRGGLFAGATVLVTRNDAIRGLFNGDVGIALRGKAGGLRVVFPRQGGVVALPAESLPAHELGFALTVHKSQGSEYAHVMVVLPPEGGRRLLTKELVYTAVTRAKKSAILCGTKEVLRFAIGRRIHREAGLLRTLT